ncbi:hypothetical protein MDUV_01690 [Mycolicibacterium duvalii]|uniref:Uncharacterized protein n=1 Tax=Mycolicibacterium duvalii TaxID=39688 RepID=A0A7I7JVI4_9MYCO|nr:hypothetical protein MDUV_01690 [Mycolicibacterium duvalii]
MFPNSYDLPPQICEVFGRGYIPSLVVQELRIPGVGISSWLSSVLWASVPEAAVYEDGDPD